MKGSGAEEDARTPQQREERCQGRPSECEECGCAVVSVGAMQRRRQ